MSNIKIPFKSRFREPMVSEVKTMTSRPRKYGKRGDTFEAWGRIFIITYVMRFNLCTIARVYWREEGFNSEEEFITFWNQIHPNKRYAPEGQAYAHFFIISKMLEREREVNARIS